ncbi:hypothetical protein SteCoe_38776 [Stentor coeruleus]|uniref:Uncharacterized protein n=1 Tax=Stentor coeruleus TaxID=5963 RepID=A0A1R2ALB3_9CILI|nr:hypothetical protein SteCoe_38776 [Stentor coeruleus]
MDQSCGIPGCPEKASYECACKENYKFCKQHMEKHSALTYCLAKALDKGTLLFMIRTKQNALDNLSTEITQLAKIMITKISNCLKENLTYISKEKRLIYNFIVNNQNEQADNLFAWAKNLQLLERNKVDFINSIKNILFIDPNFVNEMTTIEDLQRKCEKLESDYKMSNEKIQLQENQILKYEEICQKLSSDDKLKSEVKTLQKDLEQTDSKCKLLESEIVKCNKMIEDMQAKIKHYETNLQSRQISLDQASTEMDALEIDTVNKKTIEETKEIPIQDLSKSQVTNKSLVEASSNIQDSKPKFVYKSVGNF